MTKPNSVPRKFQSLIQESIDNTCQIAGMAQMAYEMLEKHSDTIPYICTKLQEIRALAYKVKSELSEIDIATDCTSCPLAPPTIRIQKNLLMFAITLERMAGELRQLEKSYR